MQGLFYNVHVYARPGIHVYMCTGVGLDNADYYQAVRDVLINNTILNTYV